VFFFFFKQHTRKQELALALLPFKTNVATSFAFTKLLHKKGCIFLAHAATVQQPQGSGRRVEIIALQS
jgi:hypothetical protein